MEKNYGVGESHNYVFDEMTIYDIYHRDKAQCNKKWLLQLNKLKHFINTYKRLPPYGDKRTIIVNLRKWMVMQESKYLNKRLDDEIVSIWEKFIEDNKKYFITKPPHKPPHKPTVEQNDQPTHTTVEPTHTTVEPTHTTVEPPHKPTIEPTHTTVEPTHTTIEQPVEPNKDKWYENLKVLTTYINEHGQLPSVSSECTDTKQLGEWLITQRVNYIMKSCIFKNDDINIVWKSFVEEYNKYFTFAITLNETKWFYRLEELRQYIHTNNTVPTVSSKDKGVQTLGKWVCTNKENYKLGVKSMKNHMICAAWKSFVEEHKDLMMTNEDKWLSRLEELREYIQTNHKTPSHTHGQTCETVKSLGKWLSHQKQNYKNNKDIMKIPRFREIWQAFATEYKIRLPQ
jgi:hypothetical protein